MSVEEILKSKGITVTDKKFGGWDNGRRMLIDKNGNELGFIPPLDALKKFAPEHLKTKE